MTRPGFLKLHRALVEKPIWKQSTPEHKAILIQILVMADFNPNEWEYKGVKYKTKPGQFVTSLQSIADECGKGISVQNVRSALARFERLGFITNESTKVNRLITIVNWSVYQARDDKGNKDTNNVTNKEVTKSQQRTNKEVTTNEEVKKLRSKEDKNVKENYYSGSSEIQNDMKDIFSFYQENGYGSINGHNGTQLRKAYEYFGSKDMIIKALEIGIESNKPNLRYVNGIFRQWKNKNIKTIEQVEAEQRQYEMNSNQFNNGQPVKRGIEPEWLKEEKQRESQEVEQNKNEEPDEETQKSIEEFQRVLAEYKQGSKK